MIVFVVYIEGLDNVTVQIRHVEILRDISIAAKYNNDLYYLTRYFFFLKKKKKKK
jgi:hypothetical protein